jgi:predicted lipoprotein with Yx(FWY)xxD motif
MKTFKNNLVTVCLAIISLTISSCDDNESVYGEDNTEEITTDVKLVTDTQLGSVLVDENGKSLYFFSKDTKETSNCEGGCINNWPVFYKQDIAVGSGLDADDFGVITRVDGTKQTTYKNWPLYYFANDTSAGDTNGDAVGGVWFIAKPDYSVMYANAQLVGNDGNNYLGDYTLGDGATSYFVSIAGRTMYTFMNDARNTNNFTKSDFSNNAVWPIVEVALDQVPSTLNSDDFGTIDVFGKTQLTYKGWPLYYFGQDTARGDNKGISVPNPGVWPVVNKGIAAAI